MLFLKKINILLCNASLKVNMAKNGINKTIGDLTNDENIINVVSQSEEDHLFRRSLNNTIKIKHEFLTSRFF